MNKCIIILPTHSKYIDIINNFLQLFKKYWNNCEYEVIISITGKKKNINDYKCIYNGENASLIDCIINVSREYKGYNIISFLGDAFFSDYIDNEMAKAFFNKLIINGFDYCSLIPEKNYYSEKKFDNNLRYINQKDRYSHSFVAFFASYKFVTKELINYNSDLDFEMRYLKNDDSLYYNNHLIVRNNIFSIIPCITKGKYDYFNFKKIEKKNPEIKFAIRQKQSLFESTLNILRKHMLGFLPTKIRIYIKKILKKIFKLSFVTDN